MTHRSALTTVATATVALGLVLGAAAPAFAHNYVVSSTPAEGETLTAVPEAWVITTNDILLDLSGSAAGFGMVVADANGLYYGDGCVTIDGRSMSSAAALGPAGDYTLTFQLISADGHTLSDSIAFRYEPTDTATVQGGLDSPPVCPGADDGTGSDGTAGSADDGSSADIESAVVLTIVAAVLAVLAAVSALVASAIVTRNRRAANNGEPPARDA